MIFKKLVKKTLFIKNKNQEMTQNKFKLESDNNCEVNQYQKSGSGSQQYQAGTIYVQQGIDEKRVREIFDEIYTQTKSELTVDALEVANKRIKEFEKTLMPMVQKVNGAMQSFSDPGFQKLLAKAHMTAVATERKNDYELLSELLMHRVTNKEDRKKYTGISKAIEIIDYIDDEALLGMTVAHAVGQLMPTSNLVIQGLDVLEELFSKLLEEKLPSGREWLEHLDLLDCVRINSITSFKRFEDYYADCMNGYVSTGIKIDSDQYNQAVNLFIANKIPLYVLQENPLLEGYYIISTVSKNKIEILSEEDGKSISFSPLQRDCIKNVLDMYINDPLLVEKVKNSFVKMIEERKHLSLVREWWNNIPVAFDITASGRVLAHANAQRCDDSIPPID